MSFSADELDAMAALLADAGRAEVMPRFRRLPEQAIRTKSGPMDLVTDADEAAEAMIARGLRARFAGCRVVGEEGAAADPALLAQVGGPGLVFVVDPIDGTANYAAGLPLFGIMAAAIVDGAVVAACIHDPVLDETCVARVGAGSWSRSPQHGSRAMRVSAAAPFERMTGTLSWRFLPAPDRARLMRAASGLAGTLDFRCAAHHYRLIADGQCHFSLYGRVLPWDHAPGWLLHHEAGGYAARFDGGGYDVTRTGGGLICAPDYESWRVLKVKLLESSEAR